ncbi:hypothetical protein HanLR1_Chr06g0211601 [Helianthus annuus]|nr:hypothetical protein HanHA89_Chr06g0227221 [Helianthus annuus]KAJ0737855.1 hypothetical protein HanLR1_Chr06g0211601 [Helianthus annuus]
MLSKYQQLMTFEHCSRPMYGLKSLTTSSTAVNSAFYIHLTQEIQVELLTTLS